MALYARLSSGFKSQLWWNLSDCLAVPTLRLWVGAVMYFKLGRRSVAPASSLMAQSTPKIPELRRIQFPSCATSLPTRTGAACPTSVVSMSDVVECACRFRGDGLVSTHHWCALVDKDGAAAPIDEGEAAAPADGDAAAAPADEDEAAAPAMHSARFF